MSLRESHRRLSCERGGDSSGRGRQARLLRVTVVVGEFVGKRGEELGVACCKILHKWRMILRPG
jgi:hypothetical protein